MFLSCIVTQKRNVLESTLSMFYCSYSKIQVGHWYFGFVTGQGWQENIRDTFENWQSEFLQLIWQVGGLTYLWYVGRHQSKEEDERNTEMLQWIIKKVYPKNSIHYCL